MKVDRLIVDPAPAQVGVHGAADDVGAQALDRAAKTVLDGVAGLDDGAIPPARDPVERWKSTGGHHDGRKPRSVRQAPLDDEVVGLFHSVVPQLLVDDPSVEVRNAAFSVAPARKGFLLREDRWVYIQYKEDASGGIELFDMEQDPLQYTNLAELPEHESVVARFKAKIVEKLRAVRNNDLSRS